MIEIWKDLSNYSNQFFIFLSLLFLNRLVPVTAPVVRPKGMGLGADKVVHGTSAPKTSSSKDEELKMVKGAHVKIVNKNQYAQASLIQQKSLNVIYLIYMYIF